MTRTTDRWAAPAVLGLVLAASATASAAQDARLIVADNHMIEANWELYADDSYIGQRAGCYESLARVEQDLTVQPSLATGWERTGDLTWVFTLRDGVVFQDGSAMDADAVANALTRLLTATVPARSFSPTVIASVDATGPMQVTITTTAPEANLPARVAAPATAILAPAAYGDSGVNPVDHCTGPFRITQWDAKTGVTVERFEDYWGGPAKLAGGEVRFIPDANTRGTMVRTGEVQISRLIPVAAAAQIGSTAGVEVAEVAAPRITGLIMQTQNGPLDNPTVRQAIRAAIDTAAISGAIYEGYSPPAGDAFRDSEPWAQNDTPPVTADLDAARALFDEAGVDPAELTLRLVTYTSKTELRDLAQIVQAMLSQLGITVTISVQDYGALEADLLAGNFDLLVLSRGYLTDVPEPIGYLNSDYTCGGGYNLSQYCDPAYDAMVAEVTAEADVDARMAGLAGLAQHIYDNAVTAYLVNETTFDAVSDSVEGFTPHPLNYYVFDTVIDVK
ncbi:MAG: ABC transporter substrate-binding protein [Paracoccus sp. (in: a-proteobacteria)]